MGQKDADSGRTAIVHLAAKYDIVVCTMQLAHRISIAFWLAASLAQAQGTLADYQRGQALRTRTQHLVVNSPGPVTWIGQTDHFWYAKSVKGGTEFVLVDAQAGAKKPAFDQEKLAAAINATGNKTTALALPFAPPAGGRGAGGGGRGLGGNAPGALMFVDNERAIQFGIEGFMYKCTLTDYVCTKGIALPRTGGRGAGGGPEAPLAQEANPEEPYGGDPVDGLEYLAPAPQQDSAAGGAGRASTGCANRLDFAGSGQGGRGGAAPVAGELPVCRSFDGKWEALIENFNIFLRQTGSKEPAAPLSFDGSEGNYYTLRSVAWSPDSKKLAAYHTRPGYDREVHYVESSPADQIQPKHTTMFYRKPGDALDIAYPALFDVATKKEVEIDHALFPNPYNLTPPCGGRTAAPSRSSTTSGGTRCIAPSRWMRRAARPAP